MTVKTFRLQSHQIKQLATNRGGCIATDMITVEGHPVGFMYREEPDNDLDSGWRFLAGSESLAYMDNPVFHSVYDVNTIANYDPSIIPLLDEPIGSEFERDDESGKLVRINNGSMAQATPPGLHPGFPVIGNELKLTQHWSITLPGKFNRRVEDGNLVFWRPGISMWLVVWNNDKSESQTQRLESLKRDATPGAYNFEELRLHGATFFSYRLLEQVGDNRCAALYAFTFGESGHVQSAIYFDDENNLATARNAWLSIREQV
jgi:hypothetical protein